MPVKNVTRTCACAPQLSHRSVASSSGSVANTVVVSSTMPLVSVPLRYEYRLEICERSTKPNVSHLQIPCHISLPSCTKPTNLLARVDIANLPDASRCILSSSQLAHRHLPSRCEAVRQSPQAVRATPLKVQRGLLLRPCHR